MGFERSLARDWTAIPSFVVLVVFCVGGNAVSRAAHLPLPGPVTGMFLLSIGLLVRQALRRGSAGAYEPVPHGLAALASLLIRHMGLLFVPAGVGLIAQADLLRRDWPEMLLAVVGSTLLGLLVTGLVMQVVSRRAERPGRDRQSSTAHYAAPSL